MVTMGIFNADLLLMHHDTVSSSSVVHSPVIRRQMSPNRAVFAVLSGTIGLKVMRHCMDPFRAKLLLEPGHAVRSAIGDDPYMIGK
jgi:hypothetical protein